MSRAPLLPALTLALLTAAGCAPMPEIALTEMLNSGDCRNATAGLSRIDLARVAALKGNRLIGISEPTPAAGPELLLLLVSRGEQPTPGYGFELDGASRDGGLLSLEVRWRTPDPDQVLAQMLTSPCLVVGLEPGGFERVRAVDQNGTLIGELAL